MPRITENKGSTVYKNRQKLIFRNVPKMYPKCTKMYLNVPGIFSPEMVCNGPKLNLSLQIISDIIR